MAGANTSPRAVPTRPAQLADSATGAGAPLETELIRKVLESAPTILYVYDVQSGHSLYQNRRFGELLGHPATDSEAGEWQFYIHPDDLIRFPEHRDALKTIAAGQSLFWEYRMRNASGQWQWFLSRDALLSTDERGAPLLIVGNAFDISEQKRAEEHKELLADEMRHRARNLVSLVDAISRLSRPKNMPEVNRHLDAFMGRLLTLLNTGSIILSSDLRRGDLRAVLDATLSPFMTGAPRIALDGPPVNLPERTAGGLALAVHELATNAVKYGALSDGNGSVRVEWTTTPREEANLLVLEWREQGGPAVSPPAAEGFGGLVIRQSMAREPGGKVTLEHRPDGVRCRFEFEIAAP